MVTPPSPLQIPLEKQEWISCWTEFNAAIRDIENDFDQFYWIRRLFITGVRYVLYLTKSKNIIHTLVQKQGHFLQFIPAFAIGLVCFVIGCYYFILHDRVIVKRWCPPCHSYDLHNGSCLINYDNNIMASPIFSYTQQQNGKNVQHQYCLWSIVHLVISHYLAFMIVWNYLVTTFTSPGFLVSSSIHKHQQQKHNDSNSNDSRKRTTPRQNQTITLKSTQGRGGCCYIDSNVCLELEYKRKRFYDSAIGKECIPSENSNCVFIPSTHNSFCKKCQLDRPPRCHHCSRCNRCVLQMDHHCIWINNCIGYNNYRTFMLTLIYLVMGCWYGICIMIKPFYESIHGQIEEHGFRMFYRNKSGFLDLPTPRSMYHEICNTGTLNPDVTIRLVFPLLFATGIFITMFAWSHCSYVIMSVTTLERMAKLQFIKEQAYVKLGESSDKTEDSMTKKKISEMKVVNPFNQGIRANIRQVFGENLLLALLPLRVSIPRPYLPNYTDKSD